VDLTPQQYLWRSCGNGACVEVTKIDRSYLIRDSKSPDGPVLVFSGAEWDAFVVGIKNGSFQFD
jgi:hypothetical protein